MSNPIRDEWQSEDGAVRLILGDCLDVLPTLSGIDAVVTDPPYGIGFAHGGGGGCLAESTRFAHETIAGDDRPFDPAPWLAFPVVVLWGANHYADKLPPKARWLVWDKRDGMASNDQADCEMAWTNATKPARLFSHKWNGMLRDGEEKKRKRQHPMQKPVRLMVWTLDQVGIEKGRIVLDPYMGVASTVVACVRTGRRAVGIEIRPGYWEIAVRRVRAELERFPLFEAVAKPRQLELLDAGAVSVFPG